MLKNVTKALKQARVSFLSDILQIIEENPGKIVNFYRSKFTKVFKININENSIVAELIICTFKIFREGICLSEHEKS